MTTPAKNEASTRRHFLKVAAAGSAAAVALPSIVNAQGPSACAFKARGRRRIFSTIRARLRKEGQRHVRRRSQDRGSSRRRGGSGLRSARCGIERYARWRTWHACLSLRQADRAGIVGFGPGLCDGRSPSSTHRSVRTSFRFRTGPMPTQPLG